MPRHDDWLPHETSVPDRTESQASEAQQAKGPTPQQASKTDREREHWLWEKETNLGNVKELQRQQNHDRDRKEMENT